MPTFMPSRIPRSSGRRVLSALLLGVLAFAAWLAARERGSTPPHPVAPPADAAAGVASDERRGPCRAVRVIDGDTLDVGCGLRRERVRLINVDTPEREQRGYTAARSALRALAGRGELWLVFAQPGRPSRDAHGRLLAYLFTGERNLNVELVRQGWSRYWARYGAGRFPEDFRRAEREASAAGRGLWAGRASP